MSNDLLNALDAAVEEFRGRLTLLRDGDWTLPTPCTDWDVHYLVAHVVGGNRFASMVLDGCTADDAIAAVMGSRQLSADPTADFDESIATQRAGFRRDGALSEAVSHPLGQLSGQQFLELRVSDIALHAWDLAVAIDADTTMDQRLVETVFELELQQAQAMGTHIGPCAQAGPDASALDRLLDLSGRCTHAHRNERRLPTESEPI